MAHMGVVPVFDRNVRAENCADTLPFEGVEYSGGPVLESVEVVPFFWGGYWDTDEGNDLVRYMEGLFDLLVAGPYIELLQEYSTPTTVIRRGRRLISVKDSISEPGMPNGTGKKITDEGVKLKLKALINDNSLPAITPNTVYVVFLPPDTAVTAYNLNSCKQFCAYHSFENDLYYCVIPILTCPECQIGNSITNTLAYSASHELAETITNPRLNAWKVIHGSEIADTKNAKNKGSKCYAIRDGYFLQKVWSRVQQTFSADKTGAWSQIDPSSLSQSPFFPGMPLAGFSWEDYKQIVYLTADGHIHELSASEQESWFHADLSHLAGAPPATANSKLCGYSWNEFKQVLFLTNDGHIHELSVSQQQGWQHADLTVRTGAPPVSGNEFTCFSWNGFKNVAFRSAAGHIIEMFCSATSNWDFADLTVLTGSPAAAASGSVSGYTWEEFKQIVYLTPAGHIIELYCSAAAGWGYEDLTSLTGAPAASVQSPLTGYAWNEFKQVVYFSLNGHIHELFVSRNIPWSFADLTAWTGGPTVSGNVLTAYPCGGFKNITYISSNGHIHEYYISAGSNWAHADLTKITGAPTTGWDKLCTFCWKNNKEVIYTPDHGGGRIRELTARI